MVWTITKRKISGYRALTIVVTIAMVLSMGACGTPQTVDESTTQETSMSSNSTDEIQASDTDTEDEVDDIQWDYAYDFSEKLAGVKFKTGKIEERQNSYEQHYFGVINKSGEMIFRIDSTNISAVTQFSNGYSYVSYSDKIDVIDSSGITVKSYPIDDSQCVRAYGDGYVLTEVHDSDFDSNGYIYTIYSPTGETIKTIETTDYSNFVRYLGKGVFLCNGMMYFVESDKELNVGTESDFHDIYFRENKVVLGIDYYDPDIDGYRGKLKILDLDGQIEEIELYPEYGWDWDGSVLAIKNNLCILYSYDYYESTLITYNLTDKSFAIMPEDSANKVVWDDIHSPLLFDDSGKIALTMQGSDGNYYVGIFDTEWTMSADPIQVRSNSNFVRGFGYSDSGYTFSDNRLIISNIGISENPETCVYDGNGNLIYKLDEKGYYGIASYSDGVACVSSWEGRYKGNGYTVHLDGDNMMELDGSESPEYLDLDGNLLFEKIDMDSVVDR